jgi:transcriptional antiterminator NusG
MKHWHALYTKPNNERLVDSLLRERGIETYFPTIRRQVRRRDRPERVVYFPSYVFARLDFDSIPHSTVAWMPGMRRVVCAGDEPVVVADEVVAMIRSRLEAIEDRGYRNFQKGDPVRITSGPLKDLDAVFDRCLSAADRVRILLDVMGRVTPVNIDGARIVPI